MSGSSAEKLLAGQPHGTYLFRTSSAGPTFLAVSYMKKGTVLHGKVCLSPSGTYSMDKYNDHFGTLSDLVVDWSPVLIQPLSRPSMATLPRGRRRGSRIIQVHTEEFSSAPRVTAVSSNSTPSTERPTLMKRGSVRGGLRRSSSHSSLHSSGTANSGTSQHTTHVPPPDVAGSQTTPNANQHRLPSRPPGVPAAAPSRIGKLPPVRTRSRRSSLARAAPPPVAAAPVYDVAPPIVGSRLKYTNLPPETPVERAPIQYEALP